MGWVADLLKEIPSAARYKAELETLETEHAALKSENATLKKQVEELSAELDEARGKNVEDLGSEKEKILILLSQRDRLSPQAVAAACGMGLELANFHLEELFESDHITNVLSMGEGAIYFLDQEGRRYLIKKGLLK